MFCQVQCHTVECFLVLKCCCVFGKSFCGLSQRWIHHAFMHLDNGHYTVVHYCQEVRSTTGSTGGLSRHRALQSCLGVHMVGWISSQCNTVWRPAQWSMYWLNLWKVQRNFRIALMSCVLSTICWSIGWGISGGHCNGPCRISSANHKYITACAGVKPVAKPSLRTLTAGLHGWASFHWYCGCWFHSSTAVI